MVAEPGSNIASKFSGSGTFDLWIAPPLFQQSSGAKATAGTYPNASGRDAPAYSIVASGAAGPANGALLATVTVSGGAITGVNNAPAGRKAITPLSQLAAVIANQQCLRSEFPGLLSGPLPAPLAYLVTAPMTITKATFAVLSAPQGASIIVQVKKVSGGVASLLWSGASAPTIAAGATSTVTTTAPDTAAASLAAGDILEVDLAQVGSSAPGTTLLTALNYTPN